MRRVMRGTVRGLALLVATPALLAACDNDGASGATRWEEDAGAIDERWSPDTTPEILGVPRPEIVGAIEDRLRGETPGDLTEHEWERVRALYGSYEGAPLWLEEEGLLERTEMLVSALRLAHTEALRVQKYPIVALRDALGAVRAGGTPTAAELARVDVLFTSAYVALAEDMLTGQIEPASVAQGWHVDAQEVDVDSALARTIRMEPLDRAIARMRPQDEDFRELREALARYREIVANGGWTEVPEGKTLRPGDTTSVQRLTALLSRLRIENMVAPEVAPSPVRDTLGRPTDRAVYDARVAGAVAEFQAHHGIVVDSILGPNTLASLNVPAEYRLGQIAANMERYRWLPRMLGETYILVNVPAFRLDAFRGGEKALEMKVIVGAEYNDRATPAFSDSMSYVQFAPYWNVPENIALEEILPAAHADPGYMARNHYEVVRGWSEDPPILGQYAPSAAAIRSGEVRIRQRPGPWNALGSVKFMFPNDFAIYLHDTPADELFERDIRAFSHGCIRVAEPAKLGSFVLGWEEERVAEAMRGAHRRVVLDAKIPVYIVYFTAYTRDDELYFGNDLYSRDEALVRAVKEAAMPDPELVQALSELERLTDRLDVDR